MAKILSKSGIGTGTTVQAGHVTQSIDAFTGTDAYDITLSGSLVVTGSITGQPGVVNALTASYAVQALTEITKEVSSSHANFADTASFALGLSGTPSITTSLVTTTNLITTNLTASGNISSSGTIIASNLSGTNTGDQNISNLAVTGSDVIFNHITASGNISSSGNISCNRINSGVVTSTELSLNEIVYTGLDSSLRGNAAFIFNEGTGTLSVNKITNVDTTHITASGNISSSGNIIGNNFIQPGLTTGRVLFAGLQKELASDADFTFEDDVLSVTEITNVNTTHITASGNISATGNISASGNITSNAISIKDTNTAFGPSLTVEGIGATSLNLFSTHGSTNRDVGINLSASSNGQEYSLALDRANNSFVIAPSNVDTANTNKVFELDALGNITSSGAITASGDIIAKNFSTVGKVTADTLITTPAIKSPTTIFQVLDNLDVVGQITASGNINSSGTIIASNLSGTNTGDQNISNLAVTGSDVIFNHITASGNISSSGNIIGNNIIGNNLTTGRVLYAGLQKELNGDADLTFSGDTLSVGTGSFNHLISSAISSSRIITTNTITAGTSIGAGTSITAATFIGDGSSITNLQRPITSSLGNISASNANSGFYFRLDGSVTVSIQSGSVVACDIGNEFEFFQTSSAGAVLFKTGSNGVTLNSKGANISLAGQFSGATLKKIASDPDEWDLIGDLG